MRRIDDYMGYLYAAASSLSMALMLLSAKVIAQGLGSFLGAFVRGISMFLINYILMKRTSVNYYAHSSEVEKLLLKRAIFGGLTMVFYLGPIAYISTSAANSLLNLGPIIVHFMEVHTLKKPIHKSHLVLTVLSFVGVLLIIKPEFIFGNGSPASLLLFLPIVAAFAHSLGLIYIHKLKGKADITVAIHYNGILQVYISGLLQIVFPLPSTYVSVGVGASLFGIAVGGYLYQYYTSKALYLKEPSHVMPFGYLTIVCMLLVDVILFDEKMDMLSVVGICLASSGLLIKLIIKE